MISVKEFLVGLVVIVMALVLTLIGFLLIPLFLVLGWFLRLAVGLIVVLLAVWLIGKTTLFLIEVLKKKDIPNPQE